jgi:hypothetical protein
MTATAEQHQDEEKLLEEEKLSAAVKNRPRNRLCFYCGLPLHQRYRCPANNESCTKCGRVGHYGRVCQSNKFKNRNKVSASVHTKSSPSYLCAVPGDVPECLKKACIRVSINGQEVKAPADTGSSDSYVSLEFIKNNKVQVLKSSSSVAMADASKSSRTVGHCFLTMRIDGRTYERTKFIVMPNLCCKLLLGQDFMALHESVLLENLPGAGSLHVTGLAAANVEPPSVFAHLTDDCHPVATKSRKFCREDEKFIQSEIKRLLAEDIIEPSSSPWRAQLLIVNNDEDNRHHKKRMVIDYSRTINRFTRLDAYPTPKIDDLVSKLAQHKIFSSYLRNAYHQIPLAHADKIFTAFEANGRLYQFKRLCLV